MTLPRMANVVIRFQICIFDILNTALLIMQENLKQL